MQGSPCGLCSAVNVVETSASDRFFIDGRLVCESCRLLFEPHGFKQRYNVCGNPLCRRKWKQLTPKALTNFCPPCRRQLEEGIDGRHTMQEIELLEGMYLRWVSIATDIAVALKHEAERPSVGDFLESPVCSPSQGHSRGRWSRVLALFGKTFRQPPKPEDVRNWNSVHGRRNQYRGFVRRHASCRFVCTLVATVELNEDKSKRKAYKSGQREFQIIDWSGSLQEGQDLLFIAFPNPAVSERDYVHRVVRLLNESDDEDAPCVKTTEDCAVVATTAGTPQCVLQPLQTRDLGTSLDWRVRLDAKPEESPTEAINKEPDMTSNSFVDFGDLMQWSQDVDGVGEIP